MVSSRDIILGLIAGFCLVFCFAFFITFFGNLSNFPLALFLGFYITGAIFFIILDHGKKNESSSFLEVNGFLPFTEQSIINRFIRYHLALLKFVIFLIGVIGGFLWLILLSSISNMSKSNFFIPSSLLYTSISIALISGIICSIIIFILGLQLDDGKKHYKLTVCGFFGGSIGLFFAIFMICLATVYLFAYKSKYFSVMN
jgi:hypothetical protein